jgi:hypothetical protein
MAMTVEPSVVEDDLAAGRLCCPACDGALSRWGFARERTVRLLHEIRSLRPRRAYCRRCEQTHVLLPAWAVARRRDGAEVIGRALLAKANGQGHRTIAATLQRPPGTVRGCLRTFARRAEPVAATSRRWTRTLEPSADHAIAPGSPFLQAVDALGGAARACRLRLAITASPWELAVALTGLLHGQPRDPPGGSEPRVAAATREWVAWSPDRCRPPVTSRESRPLSRRASPARAQRSQRATPNDTSRTLLISLPLFLGG